MAPLCSAPETDPQEAGQRAAPDRSQALRRGFQLAFLALNVWIGVEFYLFVRYYETGGRAVGRPPPGRRRLAADRLPDEPQGAAGDRPDAAPAPRRDVSADRLPRGVVDLSQELLRLAVPGGDGFGVSVAAGAPDFRPQFPPAAPAGIGLRSLKYLLLGSFPVCGGLHVRAGDPRLSGRAVRHRGRRQDAQLLPLPGCRGGIVVALLVLASVFVQNFWCRYLCPYGALMGLAALASPLRIRRETSRASTAASAPKPVPPHCRWTS